MSTRKLKSGYTTGSIAWVLPHPVMPLLSLGSGVFACTFSLRNISTVPVTIQGVDLVPGSDKRLRITSESTCQRGITLVPQAAASIVIEVNPLSPGAVKQLLRVQHNGFGPPIWLDIAFTVSDLPTGKRSSGSFLVDETRTMERQRRLFEQEGHRRLAKVHARAHSDEEPSHSPGPEGEMQNNILQNPWLDSQRFDGIDPNLNPEPPLNSEARREFDNERREQEMEKQLRLGNMPKFNTAPKPRNP